MWKIYNIVMSTNMYSIYVCGTDNIVKDGFANKDVSDQWSLPTDQYVNRQMAYAWHPARPTCERRSTKCWVLRSTPTNHPQVSDFFCRIHTRALADRPSFSLRVYLSRAFRRCLFEYMYNPPRTTLGMLCKILHIRQRRSNYKEWWYGSSSIVG